MTLSPESPDGARAVVTGRLGSVLSRSEAALMLLGFFAAWLATVQAYRAALVPTESIPGLRIGTLPAGGLREEALRERAIADAEAGLERTLQLVAGEVEVTTTPRALGARIEVDGAVAEALALGRSGAWIEDLRTRVAARRGEVSVARRYRFDDEVALRALFELVPQFERASLPTRFDLEARNILPPRVGLSLLPFDSLSAVAVGLATGAPRIELVTQPKPPVTHDTLAPLVAAGLDIGTLVGEFETSYVASTDQDDRNHNLRVGAAALDGHVVLPGETFSFNAVVGPRTPEHGYRYAPGITAGELVDVFGGGICQISSTLFGAAFFAGMEVVHARPHSRPSSYVDMGLDATVAYPQLDLQLRNPFDFPLVFHMTVRQGKVRAQVLGRQRPHRVVFERELIDVLAFETSWRDDDKLRRGIEVVSQRGMRGFKLKRTRTFMHGGKVVRRESTELDYPPTVEIRRRGTNPSGAVVVAPEAVPMREPAAHLRIVQ